jgi:hypothetical protein
MLVLVPSYLSTYKNDDIIYDDIIYDDVMWQQVSGV